MHLKRTISFLIVLTAALSILAGRLLLPVPATQAASTQTGPAKGKLQLLPKPAPRLQSFALLQTNAWSSVPTPTSLYEATTNARTMYAQGCSAAHGPAGLLILDWGQPVYMGYGQYGTYDFGGHDDSDTAILHAVANFAQGVWYCRTPSTNIALAIGQSNYYSGNALPLTTSAWYADGVQWGQMVNAVQSFVANNHYNVIGIYGAGDLEMGWENFALTSSMVNGYNNASSRIFFDFGDDAPGYWTNYQTWYVAYGARDNLPIPEIYFDADATYDWQVLNQWACAHMGSPMYIRGVMSTFIGNTPAQAWAAMYRATASNSCTAQTLPWFTFSTYIV
ncbi:MAG TPA: hypothetical protein VKV40_25225 [Ktedonobacteraceae bacterium]|nr:hypothetical protein [Ktedonobacteraceae bacterium]